MSNDAELIICTCPNRDSATTIATTLVERRLAACVNIIPGLTSVYSWQGHIESADEHLLLIKTVSSRYQDLQRAISECHPYELPEIVAFPISKGLPSYLNWIQECVPSNS